MLVVAAELGVNALQRWVFVGLGLLDTTSDKLVSHRKLYGNAVQQNSLGGTGCSPVAVGLLRLVMLRRVL
jgi:hypothetical protein